MDVKMISLMLFCVFGSVHSVTHDLHYIYTALSLPAKQPGVYQFTAMGILNDRLIDYYNSEDQVKMPKQDWMKANTKDDYWVKGTQSRKSKEQWFNVNVNILVDRMGHNKSDVHVLQWMHGCKAEKTGEERAKFIEGFDQYGYDGENFLSFDNKDAMWVAPVNQARSTKKKWDDTPILSQYTKGYLETDCVNWLETFLKYQDEQVRTSSPPKVDIFAKKSSQSDSLILMCLATEFYPPDVLVEILRNGVPLSATDGVLSSGVRPNGERVETYQLRKTLEIKASDPAKYGCRVVHRSLPGPIHVVWDGSCLNCGSNMGAIAGGIIAVILVLLVVAGVAGVLWYRKINERKIGLAQPLTETVTVPDENTPRGSLDSGKGHSSPSSSNEYVDRPLMDSGANTDASSSSSSDSDKAERKPLSLEPVI
ncbi:hypothetical protein SKAU_G00406180 [Synaphobranchus kaupii]|uniref:Ig-like domain-containing protein n=1 Tax=Synaphobranchus kaupii TaxID=118154 RepID=A0A9Q1ICU3_SYNKA|nr:hypothetical protein SKAU_G00406180 [Synaphobranchus kaupii]